MKVKFLGKYMRQVYAKQPLLCSILIFSLPFIALRLPYYLFFPIPHFSHDSFDYFSFVQVMDKGIAPDFGFIPPGYPVFLFLVKLISNKVASVVLLQSIIFFAAIIFLIHTAHHINKNLSLPVSIGMLIYSSSPMVMHLETALYTESLYTSSLIVFCALLLNIIVSQKTPLHWIFLSVAFVLPPIIRSNGIFIYFALLAVLFLMIKSKMGLKYYLYLLGPMLIINLGWAFYNYHYSKIFFPGNPNRIIHVMNRTTEETTLNSDKSNEKKEKHLTENTESKWKTFFDYWNFINRKENSFYYHYVPHRQFHYLDSAYWKKWADDYKCNEKIREQVFCNSADTLEVKVLTYREHASAQLRQKYLNRIQNFSLLVYGKNKSYMLHSPFFLATHIFSFLIDVIFENWFWCFLYFFLGIVSIKNWIQNRFCDTWSTAATIIFLMHFLSVLFVTFAHNRFQYRYGIHTEFIYYLLPAMYFTQLMQYARQIKNSLSAPQ